VIAEKSNKEKVFLKDFFFEIWQHVQTMFQIVARRT